jgi:toxin ParE1/3/4
MAEVIWTLNAINDLISIGEYISQDSEYAAQKFVKELIGKAVTLAPHPLKGRPIPEKIPGGYRQILHKSYRIIYRLENEKIFISSIYHQKKLLFKISKL